MESCSVASISQFSRKIQFVAFVFRFNFDISILVPLQTRGTSAGSGETDVAFVMFHILLDVQLRLFKALSLASVSLAHCYMVAVFFNLQFFIDRNDVD